MTTDLLTPAVFSDDRVYRYLLRRRVSFFSDLVCLFIMLNPSTADEDANDPTIRRCINFARAWGFGILEVVNLFAYRATNPRHLEAVPVGQRVGPDNDWYIRDAAGRAELRMAAWGNGGSLSGGLAGVSREREVLEMLYGDEVEVSAFGLTLERQPQHPLYLSASAPPIPLSVLRGVN